MTYDINIEFTTGDLIQFDPASNFRTNFSTKMYLGIKVLSTPNTSIQYQHIIYNITCPSEALIEDNDHQIRLPKSAIAGHRRGRLYYPHTIEPVQQATCDTDKAFISYLYLTFRLMG